MFVRARNPYSFSSSKGGKASSPDTDDEDYKLSLRADISGAVLFDDESQIYYAGVSNFDEDTTIAFGKNELPILGGTGQHIGAVGTVKFSEYEEDDEYYYHEDLKTKTIASSMNTTILRMASQAAALYLALGVA